MHNAATDHVIYLKDSPMFWRNPSFVKTNFAFNGKPSIEIFYSIMFGQESPTIVRPVVTRGTLAKNLKEVSYFVSVLVHSRDYVSGFSYPPVGTNQIDPVALMPAVLKEVTAISKDDFDLPFEEYKKRIPSILLSAFENASVKIVNVFPKTLSEMISELRSR